MEDSRPLPSDHPSFFALDRAALGDASPSVTRHVEACEQCRARLQSLGDPAPLPAALEHRLRRLAPTRRARWPWARRAWTGGLVAAAAALVLVAVVGRWPGREAPAARVVAGGGSGEAAPPSEEAYDTAKGGRVVGVFVRRGGKTFLWDGREPVRAGDALRLKVVPDGLRFVHVFSEVDGPGGASLQHIHQAAFQPRSGGLLRAAWQVDGASRREILVVVLSRAPIDVDAARAAARAAALDADTWVARLVLPVAAEERRP
jgi:hypothetical protein